jgi:hypothetical protein
MGSGLFVGGIILLVVLYTWFVFKNIGGCDCFLKIDFHKSNNFRYMIKPQLPAILWAV